MKSRSLTLLIATVALSFPPAGPLGRQSTTAPAALEGIILDAATGSPVSDVVVQGPMESPSRLPGLTLAQLQDRRPQATTGLDGRFLLTNLPPGRIAVNILKPGYVPHAISAALTAGVRAEGVVVRITGTGTLSGRVFDGGGKPVPNLRVTLLGFVNSSNYPELKKRGQVLSNDRGEFRFSELQPDQYFVAFEPALVPFPELEWRRPETSILYPGVDSLSKAEVIAVRSRENTRLNDITFPKQIPLGEVRVRMNHSGREPVKNVVYWFMSRTRSQFVSDGRNISSTPVMPAGVLPCNEGQSPPCERALTPQRFEPGASLEKTFWPTLPGTYELGARWRDVDGDLRQVTELVEFNGDDLDVTLTIARPDGRLELRVVHEEADGTVKPILEGAGLSLCRSPSGCLGPNQQSLALQLSKGSAMADGVAPGRYFVIYANGPPDTHVAAIRQGSRDVLREGVIVAGNAEEIEMLVRSGRPILTGRVVDTQGRGVADALVGVLPAAPLNSTSLLNLRRTLRADHEGRFELTGIVPGPYLVYAWSSLTENVLVAPDFDTTFRARGTAVTVEAGVPDLPFNVTILDAQPR